MVSGPIPTKKIPQLAELGPALTGDELLEIWAVNASWRIPARKFALDTDPFIMMVDYSSTFPFSRYLQDSASVVILDNGPGDSVQFIAEASAKVPTGLTTISGVSGQIDNFALADAIGFLDIDTTAGDVDLTGIITDVDGLILVISNTGPGLLQLLSLNAGSDPDNQFRLPFDMGVTQNGSIAVRKSDSIGKWVQIT